eukprot:TRINITY_DN926_c0_g1_i2.p1 TRINITY_DN926_c0_g1~~TRINITY_DN926_c0_g1_i2.p1  ORF type:complete len:167 (+),score=31.61 TRINITY_DN926_c0_g1_i2:402-902(+)
MTDYFLVYTWFPAALPLMFFAEFYLLRRMYKLKKNMRYVVSHIYLHKDGETLEIYYENKLWRKLKSDNISNLYYIPSMKTPERTEEMEPLRGDVFPEEYPYTDLHPTGYAWKKYYRNPRTFINIPKYANYADWEMLVHVFKGRIIELGKENIVEIDYDKTSRYKDL